MRQRGVHVRGHRERLMRLVFAIRMHVVDDRLVHVPSDQIDRRQRRHRAPGMRPDQIVDVRDAVLGGQLRSLVQDLEADPIADERRHVLGDDHLAPQPLRQHRDDVLHDRGIGVGSRNHFGADDHVRRIEQMHAEKIAAKRIATPARHLRDRQSRRSGRDDRLRTPALVDQLEELFFQRQVFRKRFEHDRRLANRAAEVGVIRAQRDSLGDRFSARIVLRIRQSFSGLSRRPREHRDVVPGAGEDASRAGTHRAVRADNYDLVVVGQVLSSLVDF